MFPIGLYKKWETIFIALPFFSVRIFSIASPYTAFVSYDHICGYAVQSVINFDQSNVVSSCLFPRNISLIKFLIDIREEISFSCFMIAHDQQRQQDACHCGTHDIGDRIMHTLRIMIDAVIAEENQHCIFIKLPDFTNRDSCFQSAKQNT